MGVLWDSTTDMVAAGLQLTVCFASAVMTSCAVLHPSIPRVQLQVSMPEPRWLLVIALNCPLTQAVTVYLQLAAASCHHIGCTKGTAHALHVLPDMNMTKIHLSQECLLVTSV